MYNTKRITHIVKPGDTLFQLAEHYETTAQMIISANPGIDPDNLRIGSPVIVIAGRDFDLAESSPSPQADTPSVVDKKVALLSDMRLAWLQHIYWTRMLLISIAHRLPDEAATAATLLQNPKAIADIFDKFYPQEVETIIEELLTGQLQIGGELITALRDGKTEEAAQLNKDWYVNADKIAGTFSSINPYYDRGEMGAKLHKHLELITNEIAARLAGKFPEDIQTFFEVEREAMKMADYFTAGIIRQFSDKFRGR